MVELLGDGSDRELGADHKLPGGHLKITRTNCPYAATFLDIYSISPPIYIYIYINTYIHIYKYVYIYIYMFYSSIF